MALKYDYDIHWIIPREVHDDPELGGFLEEVGFDHDNRGNYLAMFRDPATVTALRGADPDVQTFFKESGFGLDTHDSGAPDGFFPEEDLSARNDVIERLTENLGKFDLKGKDMNGINFADFLAYEVAAEPIEMSSEMGAKKQNALPGFAANLLRRLPFPAVSPRVLGLAVVMVLVLPRVVTNMLPA